MRECSTTKVVQSESTMAIFDLRGTHGSGKSFVVHQLLKMGNVPLVQYGTQLGHYIPKLGCAVLGKYHNRCGGCDGINKAEEVVRRVRVLSQRYRNVLLEGILVSHTFARYSALASEISDYSFLFLDTPLDLCISRVKQRRAERGDTRPFDPKNVIKDHHNIWDTVRGKMVEAGHSVHVIHWKTSVFDVRRLLK